MQPDSAKNIVELVERLRSGTPIEWGEVEALVAHVPAWLTLVQLIHDRVATRQLLGYQLPDYPTLFIVPQALRERLLELFQPYAILLDQRYTPVERAARLESEAGVDVTSFCEKCLYDHDPMIVEAAQAVEEADQIRWTLVRGASVPEDSPDELLRSAPPDSAPREDALLHPTEAPEAQETPPKQNWLLRLFARRKA
jgi:hypothetical protein